MAAVKAGLGLAVLPCVLTQNNNDLQEVMPSEQVYSEDVWLVSHENLRASVRVRAVIGFLSDIVSKQPFTC